MTDILYIILLSLFIIHEMDAVLYAEWKMFAKLKDLDDTLAYKIFLISHLPLYIIIFTFYSNSLCRIIVSFLLVCHAIVHVGFKKHPNNKFDGLSNCLIYLCGAVAALNLIFNFIG